MGFCSSCHKEIDNPLVARDWYGLVVCDTCHQRLVTRQNQPKESPPQHPDDESITTARKLGQKFSNSDIVGHIVVAGLALSLIFVCIIGYNNDKVGKAVVFLWFDLIELIIVVILALLLRQWLRKFKVTTRLIGIGSFLTGLGYIYFLYDFRGWRTILIFCGSAILLTGLIALAVTIGIRDAKK
jgi:hypothetical protein